MRQTALSLFLLISLHTRAQFNFLQVDTVPIIHSGDTLSFPWFGGFTNPLFSSIDMDHDSINDLFVFEREGNKIFTFLNKGEIGESKYIYAPEYEFYFPDMENWVLLVDYNCDGFEDIFTSGTSNGIAVYFNEYDPEADPEDSLPPLIFSLDTSALKTYLQSGGYTTTLVLDVPTDIPAITDIDEDGDIDILVFDVGGTSVSYHKNYSMEYTGDCYNLTYERVTSCWGQFRENGTGNQVSLGLSCKTGKTEETSNKTLHAGSTLLALDMDGDLDKELIVGDITYSNLIMLTNGGDTGFANMIAYDSIFPSNSVSVNIPSLPAAQYVDVNNDSLKDLLVVPNGLNTENFQGVWYYKNTGTMDTPIFTYEQNDFLQGNMIEVGTGAHPVFFDYNSDGLYDLVIGNYGYYNSNGSYQSSLCLYKNIGSASTPVFELVTRDYLGLSATGLLDIYPTFGDLDKDYDQDMIIGAYDGALYYYENIAEWDSPAVFTLKEANYKGIDVGISATPHIIDVDRDSLPDLIIGERNGNLNYYKNTGTDTIPDFTLISDFWGNVDVRRSGNLTGHSSPFVTFLDSTQQYYLLAGSESGYIYLYGGLDINLSGPFTLLDSMVSYINMGANASISGGDINGDGTLELLLGNNRGGVTLFAGTDSVIPPPPVKPPPPTPGNSVNHPILSSLDAVIWPDPSDGNINISMHHSLIQGNIEIIIYDVVGHRMKRFYLQDISKQGIHLDLKHFISGIYLCQIKTDSYSVVKRFVISR